MKPEKVIIPRYQGHCERCGEVLLEWMTPTNVTSDQAADLNDAWRAAVEKHVCILHTIEERVVEVLVSVLWEQETGIIGLSRARAKADRLAVRVLAAIEAAGNADNREAPNKPLGYRSLALDALRKEG